ncbi:MAG: glutamate decarboxylase [Bacillota bacterium]
MWTVVYIALNEPEAKRIRDGLSQEGLLVKLRTSKPDNDGSSAIEILVPQGEADEALEIINAL